MQVHPLSNYLFGTATLRRVWMHSLVIGAYSGLSVAKELTPFRDYGDHPANVYGSLSLVLGLLLVFRTNRSYDRWWEARTLWGRLVNVSRNLTIKAAVLVKPDKAELQKFGNLIAEFAVALKGHLRGGIANSASAHEPVQVAAQIYDQLEAWRQSGSISDNLLFTIDSEAHELLNICGGCERIMKTPLPISYPIFLHQCVLLFLFSAPWGLADTLLYWTVPVMVVQSYFMLGIESIAQAIEQPFGLDDDDLNLEGLCTTIQKSVDEIINGS